MKLPVAVVVVTIGCSAGTRSPEGAVRALAEAAAAGERQEVWKLLGPETRARLAAEARRASEMSGRRVLSPAEMLAVGWASPRFRPARIRELSRHGSRARVEVSGEHGEREEVSCVQSQGAWQVELPARPWP
jgi:hypothetical protein